MAINNGIIQTSKDFDTFNTGTVVVNSDVKNEEITGEIENAYKSKDQVENETFDSDESDSSESERDSGGFKYGSKAKKDPEDEESQEVDTDEVEETDEEEGGDDESEESESKNEKTGKEKSQVLKPRILRVKSGDRKLTIRNDAMIPVSIKGEVKEFPLQELINSKSGEVVYSEKFAELDADKKSFASEKEKFYDDRKWIEDAIEEMQTLTIQKEDPESALMVYFELIGADPVKSIANFKKTLAKQMGYDPESLNSDELELKYYRTKKETEAQKAQAIKQQETLTKTVEQKIDAIVKKHGVTFKEFQDAYLETQATNKEPTIEDVEAHLEKMLATKTTQSISEKLDFKLTPEQLTDVLTTAKANGLNEAQTIFYARELYGPAKKSALAKRVEKTPEPVKKAPKKDKFETFFSY